jgi:secondary thiamine-phosphate synthase enzyme
MAGGRAARLEAGMSKRSTATVRETAVAPATSASAGNVVVVGQDLVVESSERLEIIDVTDRVTAFVRQQAVTEGLLTVWSTHTTCALFVNEHQKALLGDFRRFLEEFVPHDRYYLHNDPEHSDCDRMNADSHVRAMLLGHSVTLPVSGGEAVLGQWQRLLAAELDGPRRRTLRLQLWGIA